MNTQEIIAYILVVIAVGYLVKTLFFKKKRKVVEEELIVSVDKNNEIFLGIVIYF